MKTLLYRWIPLSLATLILAALPAAAHHSFAAEFDSNKPIRVKGVVQRIEWVNPHAYIYLGVPVDGKTVTYAFEISSPNALKRRGWSRDSLQEGWEIIIDGYLAKDDEPLADGSIHANARMVTLGDGKTVFAGSSAGDGGPAK